MRNVISVLRVRRCLIWGEISAVGHVFLWLLDCNGSCATITSTMRNNILDTSLLCILIQLVN
jgi:hypothetical protein